MEPSTAQKIEQLQQVLSQLGKTFNGGGGNCAQVACVLDDILDAGGNFVVVAGEHYEFADHVYLRWEGLLWDMDGATSLEQAKDGWCEVEYLDEDDDEMDANEPPELEDFLDPSHSSILRMADENCIMSGGFDRADFDRQLRARLREHGWQIEDRPEPETQSPQVKPRMPRS